jgi:hypothetical protein
MTWSVIADGPPGEIGVVDLGQVGLGLAGGQAVVDSEITISSTGTAGVRVS